MQNLETVKLGDISEVITNKINVSKLEKSNYISTENMLPNRGGIYEATNLPNILLTPSFQVNDILVSNIRPYFKKIWYAKFSGGCSNDVLIFRAKQNTDPKFLYYVLSDDRFFRYAMSTSKGTKMPRGDKIAIMKYQVLKFDMGVQKKIAAVLSALDDKIELNNKINQNLEQQAQAIFKSWFVDFEPFGGKMPDDWQYVQLDEVADFTGGYSYKGNELQPSKYAMATIKNFERKGGFKLDGYKEIIPSDKCRIEQEAGLYDILVAHTDLTQNADVIGNAELLLCTDKYEKIVFSMDVVKVVSKNNMPHFVLATILKSKEFKSHCLGYVNGTTVLHLSKKALPDYIIYIPKDLSTLTQLEESLKNIYALISNNLYENNKLIQLRDALLPKLMSGEIDVSKVDISDTQMSFNSNEV